MIQRDLPALRERVPKKSERASEKSKEISLFADCDTACHMSCDAGQ